VELKIEEIWKPVINYEDKYLVSNLGNIKSIKRNKVLSPKVNWDGYLRIQLWRNNKNKYASIHKLVAESFLEKPLGNNIVVNHKNGVKNDNRLENLEWVTQQENIQHAWKNGLASAKKVNQYSIEGIFIKSFDSVKDACLSLGLNDSTGIYKTCNGKLQKAHGYKWSYDETSND